MLINEFREKNIRHFLEELSARCSKGDPTAMKVMGRLLLPRAQDAPIEIDIAEINSADDVTMAVKAVLAGMAEGKVPPAQAEKAVDALAKAGELLRKQNGFEQKPDSSSPANENDAQQPPMDDEALQKSFMRWEVETLAKTPAADPLETIAAEIAEIKREGGRENAEDIR